MKNHPPPTADIVGRVKYRGRVPQIVRVWELEKGWRFSYMNNQYEVISVDDKVFCYRVNTENGLLLTGQTLVFGKESQQKVQLVWIIRQSAMNKINQQEYEKVSNPNGIPISENGKVCH